MKVKEDKISHGLVSIVLPVYNGEKFLEQSIKSCLTQTYKNFELIIVNDCSTDTSLQIAESFTQQEKRIKVISNESNLNLPASLNVGHRQAKGEYLTWTSDDNFFAPTALEDMLFSLVKEKADLVFANFAIVNEKGEEIDQYRFNPESSILLENIVRACFLYKKDVFKCNGGYDEELFKIEDYAFWLMASSNSNIHHLPKKLYYYRTHSQSLTAKKTISNFKYERDYVQKVEEMYFKFFQKWDIRQPQKMAFVFGSLHLHQELDVRAFLKRYRTFKDDLYEIFQKYNQKKLLQEIDMRLRANILRFKTNQTPATLIWLILKRPQVLFLYSKKKSLKIIYKSLLGPFR